ncbi:tRNA (cytosine(34)-C(5))-methyltransferase isoform X2 [Zootermopsis nevadensis]|uniref:tRNA (cytosine(34)-C(5))-methyltransferase isoform X2 n=1 Tax=Zootermopsis nevadensis TaxID=136037 RepID=UPI000B8E9257|nr:tRNA (cytosine(34)-C(5))-methyltransferase isoform X2 [Zootermopsis nevadensis]
MYCGLVVKGGTIDKNKWDDKAPRRPYEEIVRENSEFEQYYKSQQICPDEEWGCFMAAIKENLPTAFRITGSKSEARALLGIVKGKFFKDCLLNHLQQDDDSQKKDEMEGQQKPICLPWYPDGLAWQLQLTRKDIRRSEAYFRLHNFLISETECGNISRQEAVSMIPPLLLDVKPHHKILDMCAAPGSKTAQLIELLHAEDGRLPTGFLIANDIDNNRCYMLVHQAKRLNSPCIVITNHDSAVMPNFTVTGTDGSPVMLKFDRVLCDVPCSGDGTLRKNPDIWLKWNTANGNNLHGIQFRILRRGVEMLSVGGRLVYSTCSFNPLENEAVIHRFLVKTEGAVQLVDVSSQLPGLKYRKGLAHWIPTSRDMVGYATYNDVPEKWHTQIRPQMFPPAPEDVGKFNLERCIRILPHQQDTGGFFVAVIEKLRPLPWEAAAKTLPAEGEKVGRDDSGMDAVGSSSEDKVPWGLQRKRRRIHGYREDPFVFFTEGEPLWPSIRDFYDINSLLSPTCLLTRCKEGKKKNIYFTSPAVHDIVVNNHQTIKLINTGVKSFVRCDNKSMQCAFRLAQEGLHSIFPYIGPKRKISVSKADLIKLLTNDDPKFPPEASSLDPSTQQQLKDIAQGSCVFVYQVEDSSCSDGGILPLSLVMVGWRGAKSMRAYVSVSDCVHYLRLCGADVSKYEKNKFIKNPSVPDEKNSDKTTMDNETDVKDEKREEEEEENAVQEKVSGHDAPT